MPLAVCGVLTQNCPPMGYDEGRILMKKLMIAAGSIFAIAGAAQAQDTAAGFAAYCEKDVKSQGYNDRQAFGGCACGTGVMGGALTQAEWVLLGRMLPGIEDQAQLERIMEGLVAEGYTVEQIVGMLQAMDVSSQKIPYVCAYYENGGAMGTSVSLEAGDRWDDLMTNSPADGVALAIEKVSVMMTPALKSGQ